MTFFGGKLNDFILDGRTVTRTDSLNDAGVQWRQVQICANNPSGFRAGIGNVTVELSSDCCENRLVGVRRMRDCRPEVRERLFHVEQVFLPKCKIRDRLVTTLSLGLVEVDGSP